MYQGQYMIKLLCLMKASHITGMKIDVFSGYKKIK
jgi:hypothetical protein